MFILFIINCYTANLAAFLTNNSANPTLHSLEDVLNEGVEIGSHEYIHGLMKVIKEIRFHTTKKILSDFSNRCI